MLSRIIRATIKSGIACGISRSTTILEGSIVGKIQDSKAPNLVNYWSTQHRFISSTVPSSVLSSYNSNNKGSLFSPPTTSPILNGLSVKIASDVPTRPVTKFSRTRGKRRTVRAIINRFYRLNWGIWIRTKAGRDSNHWKKRKSRIRRARQHVFCNSTQSWLLDKMVSPYWRKPKYWVDDPYNPYHMREDFWITRTKPQP